MNIQIPDNIPLIAIIKFAAEHRLDVKYQDAENLVMSPKPELKEKQNG